MQDSQLGPSGVLYREVPLYAGQPAGSHFIGNASSASVCTYVCTSVSTSHVACIRTSLQCFVHSADVPPSLTGD